MTVEAKKDNVRVKAIRFQECVVALGGDESVTYYVHAAIHHLPQQVLTCPVDVVDGSGSGIEHVNSVVRQGFR